MARPRGVSNYSGNFEVKIQGALDARLLVPTKAELLLHTTWENGGLEYTYIGMIVSVWNSGADSGIYRLTASDYTNPGNWDKLGASGDIATLSTALSTETSTRISSDISLSSTLSNEISTRSSQNTVLSSNISSETATRSSQNTVLSSNISSEVSTRLSQDNVLSSAISSEASTRLSSDNTFLVKSNNLSDLTNTTTARGNIGLGNVDNTADANKSVNYATTAGTAGSASGVAWSNVSSKPTWASTNIYDAGIGTYISGPVWMPNTARFGDFSNSVVREFNCWGQHVLTPLIASSTSSYTIDRREGWGSSTASLVVIPYASSGSANTKTIYLPGAADPGQTVTVGTEIRFINQGWNHYTIIGRRLDSPGPCGYKLVWGGNSGVDSGTWEDFITISFIFGGTYWCLSSYYA